MRFLLWDMFVSGAFWFLSAMVFISMNRLLNGNISYLFQSFEANLHSICESQEDVGIPRGLLRIRTTSSLSLKHQALLSQIVRLFQTFLGSDTCKQGWVRMFSWWFFFTKNPEFPQRFPTPSSVFFWSRSIPKEDRALLTKVVQHLALGRTCWQLAAWTFLEVNSRFDSRLTLC